MKLMTAIIILASSFPTLASARSAGMSSLLKSAGGETLLVTSLESAAEACLQRGMSLPTARDFAELAMQKGAAGITEVEQESEAAENSYVVDVYTEGQPRDRFLYSQAGYNATKEDAEASCVWTSSLNPNHPLTYHQYLVTYNPIVGAIHTQTSDYRNTIVSCAVQCKK